MPPTKRRRLSDLYVVGKEAEFDDGQIDPETQQPFGPVQVWIQKINTVENEEALRRASALRARHLTYARDEDSDEWKAAYADTLDFTSRENLIDLAMADELRVRMLKIEAELAAEEEWSKDDYLQGLVDAWEGSPASPTMPEVTGLKERWAVEPGDPEAARVKAELDRFNDKARTLVEAERETLRSEWEQVSEDDLRMKAVRRVVEQRAMTAFVQEFELWQLYFAIREFDNHGQYYFTGRDEVATLDIDLREHLIREYRKVAVDPQEGKGLPGTPGSSPSSDPAEQEETPDSSGLVDAMA